MHGGAEQKQAMNGWSQHSEPILSGRGRKFFIATGSMPLSYANALDLLAGEPRFRDYLTQILVNCGYAAFRWETPPISNALSDRRFEFVVVDDPYLETAPEPEVFASWFDGVDKATTVRCVPNLGHDALLIVPRHTGPSTHFTHLAAFVRNAAQPQIHALWQCAATTVLAQLSEGPLWLSTAGGGVAWLHMRIERTPKYYAYRPYANEV